MLAAVEQGYTHLISGFASGVDFRGCYEVRNRYMVNASNQVIAVWDERETDVMAATVQYANTREAKFFVIDMSLKENDE